MATTNLYREYRRVLNTRATRGVWPNGGVRIDEYTPPRGERIPAGVWYRTRPQGQAVLEWSIPGWATLDELRTLIEGMLPVDESAVVEQT